MLFRTFAAHVHVFISVMLGCNHRENVCCARARLHIETVPVDTYRTRFTRVPVRCMYGPVCYRIGILYNGMSRKHGRPLTRK